MMPVFIRRAMSSTAAGFCEMTPPVSQYPVSMARLTALSAGRRAIVLASWDKAAAVAPRLPGCRHGG